MQMEDPIDGCRADISVPMRDWLSRCRETNHPDNLFFALGRRIEHRENPENERAGDFLFGASAIWTVRVETDDQTRNTRNESAFNPRRDLVRSKITGADRRLVVIGKQRKNREFALASIVIKKRQAR